MLNYLYSFNVNSQRERQLIDPEVTFLPKINYCKILFSNIEPTKFGTFSQAFPGELIKNAMLPGGTKTTKTPPSIRNLKVTWIIITKFRDTLGIWSTAAQVINTEYFMLQKKGIYVVNNKSDFFWLTDFMIFISVMIDPFL